MLVLTGPDSGSEFPIKGKLIAGRLQTCDITLQEGQSSRKHFEVESIGPSCFRVTDLESRNGSSVNAEPLKGSRILANGDVVAVGETQLGFYYDRPDLAPASTFVDFTVLTEARASPFGYQFKARQRSLDRDVTLEVLSAELASDAAIAERFLAMHKSTGLFDHPKILNVYDVGRYKSMPYASLAYFDGETLAERYSGILAPTEDALEICAQLAEALAHIHGRDRCHGRLNPSTVLVDAAGAIRLIGFGDDPRGRVSDPALPGAARQAGFCAPELARGRDARPESDVYSLGALAYWLLSGASPYSGAKAADVLRLQAQPEPVPPLSRVLPELPPAVEETVAELLAKAPGERPADGRAAVELLARCREEMNKPARKGPRKGRRKGGRGKSRRRPSSESRAKKAMASSGSALTGSSGLAASAVSTSSEAIRPAPIPPVVTAPSSDSGLKSAPPVAKQPKRRPRPMRRQQSLKEALTDPRTVVTWLVIAALVYAGGYFATRMVAKLLDL